MLKIIVCGATGRMGQAVIRVIQENKNTELAGGIEKKGHPGLGKDLGELSGSSRINLSLRDDLSEVIEQGEIVIDFSHPSASLEYLRIAAEKQKAMVIGTTGFSNEERGEIENLGRTIPCVLSPNMSIGVNVMFKAIEMVAGALGEEYDLEVIEAHHRYKKDAPSGTALKLAEILANVRRKKLAEVGVYSRQGFIGERKKDEIGIQTIRAGDLAGEHTVLFGGMGERLEITHRVQNREIFARGAVRAAQWLSKQPPGLYSLQAVLGLSK